MQILNIQEHNLFSLSIPDDVIQKIQDAIHGTAIKSTPVIDISNETFLSNSTSHAISSQII